MHKTLGPTRRTCECWFGLHDIPRGCGGCYKSYRWHERAIFGLFSEIIARPGEHAEFYEFWACQWVTNWLCWHGKLIIIRTASRVYRDQSCPPAGPPGPHNPSGLPGSLTAKKKLNNCCTPGLESVTLGWVHLKSDVVLHKHSPSCSPALPPCWSSIYDITWGRGGHYKYLHIV